MRSNRDPASTFRLRRALYRVAFSALRWTALERPSAGGLRLPGSPQAAPPSTAAAAPRLCLSAAQPEAAGTACQACTHPGAPCSHRAALDPASCLEASPTVG